MRMPAETRIEEFDVGTHKRPHILVSIVTLGMVPIEFVVALSRLQFPINGLTYQHVVKGVEVGKARNMAVEHLLSFPKEQRPEWLFFVGDDMLPPWDGFIRLYEEAVGNKWDCLTGLYFWKGEPPTPLTWRNDHIGRLIPGKHFRVGEVIHVDLTGLDFTLIRTSILEKIDPPWFQTGPSYVKAPNGWECSRNEKPIMRHTEDVWFYEKVRKVGGTIGVHTGVRVAHYDVKTGKIY